MKKLIIIIALIAVYGISVSGTSAKEMNSVKAKTTIVSDTGDNKEAVKEEKNKKEKKEVKKEAAASKEGCGGESETKSKEATPASGCSEAQKKSCAASQKSCCGEKK